MVGEGYTAFESAHFNMQTIQNLSDQIPAVIRDLVNLLYVEGFSTSLPAILSNPCTEFRDLSWKLKSYFKMVSMTW
jgi:hypothetical protein